MCFQRFVLQALVQYPEVCFHLLFVSEYFHHFLSADHFFRIAVHHSQCFLLRFEVFPAPFHNAFGTEEHQRDGNQRYRCQYRADKDHQAENTDNRQCTGQHIGQAVGQCVTDAVDIVGVPAHDITVLMGVEVSDRQTFHLAEQFLTHPGHGALSYLIQQDIFDVSSRHSCQVDSCQEQQDAHQSLKVARQDVVVDNRAKHVRSGEVGRNADHDQHTDHNQ